MAVVILAAGASSRMGQPKLLLRWQGSSLVRRVAKTAVRSGGEPVILVTGPRDSEMRQEVRDLPIQVIHNPDYSEGMSTSLRAGLAALPDNASAAVILLGDQPLVTPVVVEMLISAYREADAAIVQPRYASQPGNPVLFDRSMFAELLAQSGDQGGREVVQQPGNPVLFDRSMFAELLAQSGDQGGREVVRAHRDHITYVDFERGDFQRDVDTPDDYASLVNEPTETRTSA